MNPSYKNPAADTWYSTISKDLSKFPFRFYCDGTLIEGFPQDLFSVEDRTCTGNKEKETLTLTLKKDKTLYVTVKLTHYFLYGATEWTLWFENRGEEDSPLISGAETLLSFEGSNPVLKGILGDHVNKYRPYCLDVADFPRYFESESSRATHVYFPYFNLEYGIAESCLP